MRKTITLGALIALFGIGALAQAKDVTATEPKSPTEASQPDASAVQGKESVRERRSASREARDGGREHHDEASERHEQNREHDRRH
jgi:hypothetical protein